MPGMCCAPVWRRKSPAISPPGPRQPAVRGSRREGLDAMCCTLANARLSNTILYAAEVCPDGKEVVHVLGYQNRVQNLPPAKGPSGNAMILPFPAVAGTMTQNNVLATDKCPKILED